MGEAKASRFITKFITYAMTTETKTSASNTTLGAALFVVPVVVGAFFVASLGIAPQKALADGIEDDWSYYDGGYGDDDWSYYGGGYDDDWVVYDYADDWEYYDYNDDWVVYDYDDDWEYYDYNDDWEYYSYDDWSYYDYNDYSSCYSCGGSYWEWEFEWDYDYDYDYDRDREPKPTCDITASDLTIDEGDSTTLRWDSRYADDAELSGHGDVSENGTKKVSPNNTTTYRLTVTGNGGKDTCSVTVRVDEDDDDDDDDPWCKLDVDDRSVEEGDEVTLEWDTRNADYASINQGVGRVDEDGGEEDVEIDDDDDVTFRMTVRNDDGDEDTCSVTVRVDDDDRNEFSSVSFDSDSVQNPPVVYLSDLPYTGIEDMSPSMIGFWLALAALLGVGSYYVFVKRQKVRA